MSLELWSTVASIGTFVVIAASAIAAVIQLRHLRASNALAGLLTVLSRVEDPIYGTWFDNATTLLSNKLPDPNYRRSIEAGTFERANNPWLSICNSYEWVGNLIKYKLIPEDAFMDLYSAVLVRNWSLVEDVVALRRHTGDDSIYENFELLVVKAKEWEKHHPRGAYPPGKPRLQIRDRWPVAKP